MATLLQFFDAYVTAGLQPIAVYKNSKCPVGRNWNQDWSVEQWRPFFEDSKYNMGILLGNVIDVEADTDEANIRLLRMIGNAPHPMFQSSKSIHHLFLTPDPSLTRFVVDGIEFRGHLHQSVVPPSCHDSGTQYKWLAESTMPIPELPTALNDFYFLHKKSRNKNKKPSKKKWLREGHQKTGCRICKQSFFIHKKRLMLEVRAFQSFNLPWMCHGCREINMKEKCREIRKSIKQEVHGNLDIFLIK